MALEAAVRAARQAPTERPSKLVPPAVADALASVGRTRFPGPHPDPRPARGCGRV